MQPLDTGLNVAITHIASRLFPTGFDVSDDAPRTFDQLTRLSQLAPIRGNFADGAAA